MEKGTLVLVLDPEDPQLADIRQTGEVIFGIVQEVLDQSGMYQKFRCRVRYNAGVLTKLFRVGRLVPLLVLSEEDAAMFSPTEAFSKWAAEIVKRQALVHLPEAQRDFLANLLTKT